MGLFLTNLFTVEQHQVDSAAACATYSVNLAVPQVVQGWNLMANSIYCLARRGMHVVHSIVLLIA